MSQIVLAIDGPSPNVGSGLKPPYGVATTTEDGISVGGTGLGLPAAGITNTTMLEPDRAGHPLHRPGPAAQPGNCRHRKRRRGPGRDSHFYCDGSWSPGHRSGPGPAERNDHHEPGSLPGLTRFTSTKLAMLPECEALVLMEMRRGPCRRFPMRKVGR